MARTGTPNILFFLPDQWRPDWLGLNDELPLQTPNIDRLAAEGVRFTRAITPSPLCAPARAALAAGREYDHCGVVDNGQNYPLDQPTYYQALRDAGYRVCGVGKFDLHKPHPLDWGVDGSRLIEEWGFTEGIDNEGKLDGSTSYRKNDSQPTGPYLAALQNAGLAEDYCREHGNRKETRDAYTTVVPDELYCDNWLANNGLAFLKAFPGDAPWHLVVNFTGPHNPMDVTASMRERWAGVEFPPPHANDQADYTEEDHQRNRQNYAAMCENIDHLCGLFIDLVRERGELENTLIVFASDHGEMLGDFGKWGKSSWRFPSAGIPLIVKGPGVRDGVVTDAPAALQDLAPTFLDYAGATVPETMTAPSMRPVLEGKSEQHREVAVGGLHDWRLATDGRYVLVRTEPDAEPMLFDRAADPWEETDVAAEHPEIVARLRPWLDAPAG